MTIINPAGLQFINQFAGLTNADVAASNDITGSTVSGGNWHLEATTGTVESSVALSAVAMNDYADSLAIDTAVSKTPVIDVAVAAGVAPMEGATTGTFTVTLDSAAPAGGLTVNYKLAGSATLNTDYKVTAGANMTVVTGSSFTIAAGQTSATLNVIAINDDVSDPKETVGLNLTAGTGYQLPLGRVITFSPKADYATGSRPDPMSVADFNNDGKLDLAVVSGWDNTVSVLLRNADNTGFDAKSDFVTGWNPNSVSVGDLNNDGKLDLAVANGSNANVSVFLRNATNTGFETKVDVAIDPNPKSVSVGDFNNDGKADLAVVNAYFGSGVSVFLRNADNTGFDAKLNYSTGLEPASVNAGDFNNDGKLDLAVANWRSGTVSVLLRNAANTGFEAKIDYTTGEYPRSVSVGDFNNDGKLDLAVFNYGSKTVSVLLRNTANTGFDTKVDYATGSGFFVNVGDFNNDGKSDLVVLNGGNTASVLLRNAANTGFDTKVDYAIGEYSNSVSVGDFNNDGKIDLALSNEISNTVSVFLNNSNPIATLTIADRPFINTAPIVVAGTTTVFTEQTPIAVTRTIAINDVDGDTSWNGGTLKIQITANATSDDSLTLPTANNGGIWLNTSGNVLMADDTAIGSANAPVVNNANTWLFSFNTAASNAMVQDTARAIQFTNNSDTPDTRTRSLTFTPTDKYLGTHSDIQTVNVTAVNDAPTLSGFFTPIADGIEDSQMTVTLANLQSQADEADVDGTVTAFVIKAISSGALQIGSSAGAAKAWAAGTNDVVDVTHNAYWTPAADVNGILNAFMAVAKDDGGLESVTSVQATVKVMAVPDLAVTGGLIPVEGGTVGTFTVTLNSAAPAGGLTVNYTLAGTATLNTDYKVTAGANMAAVTGSSFTIAAGQTDAVLNVNAASDEVSDIDETVDFNLTKGTGYQFISSVTTFSSKADYLSYPNAVSVGDFNNDGKLDLVTANDTSNSVSVFLRNAANTGFDAKVDYETAPGSKFVCVADFNNDGKLDLATANKNGGTHFYNGTVSVLLRNAANTGFNAKVDYEAGNSPGSISAGDFNNDGKVDLAVAISGSDVVSVLLRNAANNGFNTKVDYATGRQPSSVSVGDFNNDGKFDLAVANDGSATVSVFLRNAANTGFDTKVDYATGLHPTSVSVGDFNNDGKLDLAVANATNTDFDTVSVLLRNAENTGFAAKVDYATGNLPSSVSTGDFNNDGKLDLVVANRGSDSVSVLLRNAANTGFDAKVDYATGQFSWPRSVSVGDFNNDGKLDLATANTGNNTVSVLLNNSNPTATLTIADTPFSNTAPTVIAGTTTIFTEQTPVAVTPTITINDVDGNAHWKGGTLKVQITANATANDGLALPTANSSGIWLNTVNNILMANTTAIGTANAPVVSNGAEWILTFNAAATNALVQSTARAIQFTNNSDSPNTTDRTVTFTATDKNAATESALQTVNLIAVNDAPTLTAFASALAVGNEDSEMAVTFADLQTQGNEADVDGTVLEFVLKSVSSGTLKIGLSALTATAWNATTNNTVDTTHNVYWTPAANAKGTLNAFTAIAKDNDGLESTTAIQATFNVTAVNDAPAGADKLVTTLEDTAYTLKTADFGFTDPNDTEANSLLALKIANLPVAGMLTLNGVAVTTGQFVSATDIAANKLAFNPVANANGLGYASFTFQVQDNGGTANGGVDFVLTANTLTFNVTPVNDGPPALRTPVVINYLDTVFDDTFVSVTGLLAASDIDGTPITYGITGGTDIGGDSINMSSPYGVLTVNKATGAYNFVANDAALEALTLAASTRFTVTASDGSLTDSEMLVINIAQNGSTESIGNDRLIGTSGNDRLDGLVGADTMAGRSGNDSYVVDNPRDMVIENTRGGIDTVFSSINYALKFNVENLTLSGTSELNGTGNTLNNVLTGNAGDNTLNGGVGVDTLIGGSGNDVYIVDNKDDVVTETSTLATETDTVKSSKTYTLGANLENLTLTGSAAINGTGNALNNFLTGNKGANVLDGGGGDDTLEGGIGNDTLTGGAGHDTFQLKNTSKDTITDFSVSDDTIQLENSVFTQLTTTDLTETGVLNTSNFKIGATAVEADDYVIYDSDTGALYYDANGSDAGGAIQIAVLGIGLALTHADFFVI